MQVGGVGWFESTVVCPVGGDSPHLGQKVAVEVIVVVETVCVTEVILPLVTVTGQVVSVVTTISVVTISEVDGGLVTPPVGMQTEPDIVSVSLQDVVAETGVVRGTQEPETEVIELPHVTGGVTPPVGVFGTQEPL